MHHSTRAVIQHSRRPSLLQLGHSCIHKASIWLNGEEAHVEGFTHSTRSAQELPRSYDSRPYMSLFYNVLHVAAAWVTHGGKMF